jgi:hypothetical protein
MPPLVRAARPRQTDGVSDDLFRQAVRRLTEEEFQDRFGRWDALEPAAIAAELAGCGMPWWVAGGRAARAGAATARRHEDTDITVLAADLEPVRAAMSGWHLWEVVSGALRPLLPGVPVRAECDQLWVRRDAASPWRMEFLIDRVSTRAEWVFKRDATVRLPWDRAAQLIDGIGYLRPEVALLYKTARADPKDKADFAAARLTGEGRAWLTATLGRLGQAEWAGLLPDADRTS